MQLELVDAMIDVLWRLSTELLKMQLYAKHGQQPTVEIEALAPSARAEVKARVAHGETLDDDASRLQLIEHVQSGGPRKPAKSRYMMWFSQRRDHRRKSSVGAVSSAASEQHTQGKLLSRMSTSSLLGGRKQSEAVLS